MKSFLRKSLGIVAAVILPISAVAAFVGVLVPDEMPGKLLVVAICVLVFTLSLWVVKKLKPSTFASWLEVLPWM